MRRRLVAMSYKSYSTKEKPLRKLEQPKRRLYFAQGYQYWFNKWKKVIWSNEAYLHNYSIEKVAYSFVIYKPKVSIYLILLC